MLSHANSALTFSMIGESEHVQRKHSTVKEGSSCWGHSYLVAFLTVNKAMC